MNYCTCDNGVGQTGAGCPVEGTAKCASCNAGFTLNDRRGECIRTCARVPICTCTSKPIIILKHDLASSVLLQCTYLHRLLGNVCACDNGVAQSGAECPVNGATKCASCNAGWTINDGRTECTRTCTNLRRINRAYTEMVKACVLHFCSECVYM